MNHPSYRNIHYIEPSVPHSFFPASFQPGQYDVIVGRGRKGNDHKGNERLRRIVRSRLEEYSAAEKEGKSYIISSTVDQIETGTPKGAFVKQDLSTRLWFLVEFSTAREKVSRMFRDALHVKLHAFNKRKSLKKDKKSHAISDHFTDSQSQVKTTWTEESDQNSQRSNGHSGNLALTHFDVFTAPREPSGSVELMKHSLFHSSNSNFVSKSLESKSEVSESEDDWFCLLQNFIAFTKTDEFEKFEISRT